jgi:hypothetical protein
VNLGGELDRCVEGAALKKDVKKFKAEATQALEALKADPSRLVNRDPFRNVDKIAKKLGLKECGEHLRRASLPATR